LGSLLVAFIVAFTVFTGVVVGVLVAYGAVTGILYAFGYKSRERNHRTSALVPSEAPSGGD